MAHFAEIDSDNNVIQVLVISNDEIGETNDAATENAGIAFLRSINGEDKNYVQTSYNTRRNEHVLGGTPFRWNYAEVGGTWDAENQGFIPPKPFASWVWNDTAKDWDPPTGYPPEGTGIVSTWNESEGRYDQWDAETETWSPYTW